MEITSINSKLLARMFLAGAAVNLNLYRFYIRVPDFIGSSMGMAYSITKVSRLFANSTFSHDSTSLIIHTVGCKNP